MRSCMCFPVLQNSRCGMRLINGNLMLQPISYTSIWFDNLRRIGSSLPSNSVKAGCTNSNRHPKEENKAALWANKNKRLAETLKQLQTTKVYTRKNITHCDKPAIVRRNDVFDGVITESTKLHTMKSEVNEFESIKFYDVQQKIEGRDTQRHVTIFVFDIETTGLSRKEERIIDLALRDLNGGDNSTFQTLINPERSVLNAHIHGISTPMVNRPGVPRFKDLVPILRHYIQSRRIPNTPILLVSHNARCFDVPFLINEFSRCSEEIPSDWLFLDTLPLARELAKLEGTENLSGKSVQALREYYGIPLVGKAHTAMSDVDTLSRVLQGMTIDLKLPVSGLLERSFKASDIVKKKK